MTRSGACPSHEVNAADSGGGGPRFARGPGPRLRLRAAVVGGLIGCSALSACGGSDSGGASTSGTGSSAQATLTAQFAPIFGCATLRVGIDKGFFAKNGVKLQTKPYAVDSSVPLVLNGQTQIGFGGVGAIIAARSKGIPITMIAATSTEGATTKTNSTGVVASAKSGIKSFKDLTGRKVGLNALGNDAQAHVAALIDAAGGNSKSVKWQVVPFPGQPAALKGGQIDAVAAVAPFSQQMVAAGARNIGPYNPKGYTSGAYFASDAYRKKNPEAVAKFLAGLREASEYSNAHRSEALAALATAAGLPKAALAAFPPVPWSVKPNRETTANAIALMAKYGFISKAPPVDEVIAQ